MPTTTTDTDRSPLTPERIQEILAAHREWLRGAGGSRASLSGADLYGADLSRASLSGADLYGANLYRASLYGADLSRVNLSRASLSGADLSGADLSRASLSGADLYGANLSGADLYGADLSRVNLSRASLSGANLSGADLYRADLSGANLHGASLAWQSHDLIAELLRRAAEGDIDRLKVAGVILVKRDWCWRDFVGLGDPLTDWALDTLAAYVQDGDEAPVELRKRAAKTGEVQS